MPAPQASKHQRVEEANRKAGREVGAGMWTVGRHKAVGWDPPILPQNRVSAADDIRGGH
jgi:hypothetical protein